MISSEKHRLRSVIPKPRDSDEEDPVVELNEEGEALNIESVTERLATDLKVAEDEEEEGGGEKNGLRRRRDGEEVRGSEDARVEGSTRATHFHGIGERWEMWTSKSGREDDC